MISTHQSILIILFVLCLASLFLYPKFPRLERALEDMRKTFNRAHFEDGIGQSISLECGEICSYNIKDEKPGKYYPFLKKSIDCISIMERMAQNPPIPLLAPRRIPEEKYDEFTQNGELPNTKFWYFNDSKPAKQKIFSEKDIENLIRKDKAGVNINVYRAPEPKNAITAYVNKIKHKRGVIIGSLTPWLEAQALSAGAEHVTTLEYNNFLFQHPKVTKMHPSEMTGKYKNGSFKPFDFALSFSSIEHAGLGRYGDPLNPYGDLEAVAQVWCMLKPGGIFLLGLPGTNAEASYMQFNGYRVYGYSRLKHLTANFEVLEHFKAWHSVWVLKKMQ